MPLRFLLLGLGIFLLYKLFRNEFARKNKVRREAEKSTVADKDKSAGELVKDPVCGAYVSMEDSVSVRDGEKVFYFCGYECRDAYLKQLEKGRHVLPSKDLDPEE